MSRGTRHRVGHRRAAALGAVAVASLSLATPAAAAYSSELVETTGSPAVGCASPASVIVVVDPGPLGGEPAATCAPEGGGSTAAAATVGAGVALAYASGQPFVCRVDGLPGSDAEDCRGTPPGDGYWALFWAGPEDERWSYSTLGAASLPIPGGGAVAWRFQDGGRREHPAWRPAAAAASATPRPASRPDPRVSPAAGAAPDRASGASAPEADVAVGAGPDSGAQEDPAAGLTGVAALAVLVLAVSAGVLWRRRG